MMSDESARADGRRRKMRPGVKVLLLIVVPVLALVISWMALDVTTGWKLEAVLADIRGRGWPTEVADLYPAPIPDSENAAPLYRRALANGRFASKDTEWLDSLQGWAALSAEEKAKVRADLVQSAEALGLLHRAGQRRACDFRLDYGEGYSIELPHLSQLRRSTRLERAALIVALADGRTQDALGHWLDMVAIVRHQEGQRLLIGELVRLACLYMVCEAAQALIQNGMLSAEQVESALAALDGLESRESFVVGLQGELVVFHDFVGKDPQGVVETASFGWDLPGCDLSTKSERLIRLASAKVYESPLGRPWRQYDEATGLSLCQEGIELLEQPFYAVQGRLSEWRQRVATPPGNAPWTGYCLPVWDDLGEKIARAEAEATAARTALALERYRLAHGDYPRALEALVPGILPQVPLDPFDGKPLRYVNDGKRVVVYSVGQDLQDDGGSDELGDLYPDRLYPKDIVFTLRPGPKTEGKE